MTVNKTLIACTLAALSGCASMHADTVAPDAERDLPPIAAVTQSPQPVAEPADAPAADPGWIEFLQARDRYLDELAAPILSCEGRSCDAPLATLASLMSLYRITHDGRYTEAADRLATATVERMDLGTLTPYDAAWFLLFAREYETATGGTAYRDRADAVAQRLMTGVSTLEEHEFAHGIMFGNQQNVAFSVEALWRWAQHTQDAELTSTITALTKARLLAVDVDGWCPMPVDGEPEVFEFLPPCLERAGAVLAVMPEQIANPWLKRFVADQTKLEPIADATWATHEALNFARARELWAVYQATGDARFRRMYTAHIRTEMETIARNGLSDGRIARFGIEAIALSVE